MKWPIFGDGIACRYIIFPYLCIAQNAKADVQFGHGYIDQVKRNPKTTKNLCWVIIDNPGFDLKYKDIKTKCVHVKKEDME